jgi:hypothetical protein
LPNALREFLTPEEEDTQVKDPKNVEQSEDDSSTEKKRKNQENEDEN